MDYSLISKYPQPIFISGCVINWNTTPSYTPPPSKSENPLKELIKSMSEEEEEDNTWKWIAGFVVAGLAILALYLWLRQPKEETAIGSLKPLRMSAEEPQENQMKETNDLLKSMINQTKPSNTYLTNQCKVRTAGNPVMVVQPNNSRTFVIKANTDNTNKIYVGTRGVTPTTGIPLDPGESFSLDVRMDKSSIYIDADTDGNGASFMLFS